MNAIERLFLFLQSKLQQGEVDFRELPFPAFVTDTRSSPLQVRFEQDVRNDRNLASWKAKWRLMMFNEGRYGWQPIEEKVGMRRPALPATERKHKSIGLDPFSESGKLRALIDARAA